MPEFSSHHDTTRHGTSPRSTPRHDTMNTVIDSATAAREAFNAAQMQMLTDTIMRGASADEVKFFAEVCRRANLDPFRKQIHAVQRWDNRLKRMVWSYQTGIDGFRAIAQRTGLYAGSDEPVFDPPNETAPHPRKAIVTVWKLVAGQRVPFTASARWSEYVQLTKDGNPNSMWMKMPYGQLAKCAEALALRKAFPEELSGLHSDEEMMQADSEIERNNAAKFDLQRRVFSRKAEPGQSGGAVPVPSDPPPDKQTVEAEVVAQPGESQPPPAEMPVPPPIAEFIGGRWKTCAMADGGGLGSLKVGVLRSLREAPPDDLVNPLLASWVDEIRATIKKANRDEDEFSVIAESEGGVESAAALWKDPSRYPALLAIAKQL